MDGDSFKEAMRRFAASVCVVTAARPGGPRHGLTATSVCSLSADPPSLLCCVNRSSNSYMAITEARAFCINLLSVEDAAVAHQFAGDRSGDEKFRAGAWRQGLSGAPVLETALAAFDCTLSQSVEAGSHAILIGEVAEITLARGGGRPLLYAQGGYGQFTAEDARAALNAG